jgi:hypothetical protein
VFEKVTLSDISIVKNRSLLSRYRELAYPDFTPFYLYGTPEETFIDHALTRATNVQITTPTKVSLTLDKALTAAQLGVGVLAIFGEPERAQQPPGNSTQRLIRSGQREFSVTIYADPHPATANGPGLIDITGTALTRGTVTLAEWPWIWLGLNVGRDPPKVNQSDQTPTTIEGLLAASQPIMETQTTLRSGHVQEETLSPWIRDLRNAGLIRDRSRKPAS